MLGSIEGALGAPFGKLSGGRRQPMSACEIALRFAVQSAARTAGAKIG
jgi:hypothetical protein